MRYDTVIQNELQPQFSLLIQTHNIYNTDQDARMATKRALNKVASTEAGFVGACRAAAKSVHRILAVITARFDRLELRLESRWWPKSVQRSKRPTFEHLQIARSGIEAARFL